MELAIINGTYRDSSSKNSSRKSRFVSKTKSTKKLFSKQLKIEAEQFLINNFNIALVTECFMVIIFVRLS